MYKLKKIIIFLAFAFPLFADAQSYQWAKVIGGALAANEPNIANCVTTDASGNVYTTGNFFGSNVNFNPGFVPVILSSGTAAPDVFFAKYTAVGNCLWARSIVGSQGRGYSISVDAGGNVYVTGIFGGSGVDIDPGPGTATLSATISDIFVAKYDASGNYLWAIGIGGAGGDFSKSIALDASGNVYVTGRFQSSIVDFDPGPGIANLTLSGNTDIFIAKFTTGGNYLWAKSVGGVGNNINLSNAITTDASGNAYITGYFQGAAVDFDPGPATATLGSSGSDIYFAKYDVNGNYIWAKSISAANNTNAGLSISADGPGNIYVTGNFQGSIVDFDPGPATATLNAGSSTAMFFGKYGTNGNYIWAKSIPNATGISIAKNAAGKVYVTGGFSSPVDFDPGPGTATLSGTSNIFFAKYDASGNYVWAKPIEGTTYNTYARSITVDGTDNVYITGALTGTNVDFDPSPGTATLNTNNIYNMYVAKYAHCGAQYTSQKMACSSTGYSINGHLYTSDGTYMDTLYTSFGCDSIVVTQLTLSAQLPTVAVISNAALCEGFNNNLLASGAISYTWSTGAQTSSINVTPTNVVQYVVTGTGSSGCVASASLAVIPSPTINIAGNITACKGSVLTLSAGAASSYSWNTGAQTPTIQMTANATSFYSVTASFSNSPCKARQTHTVTVSDCVGLNRYPSSTGQITTFPNPAKNELFYNLGYFGSHSFSISDHNGIVLETGEQQCAKCSINVEKYVSGIYYLSVTTSKTSKTTRFVKE
jgi:hypothetical protein